MFNDQDKNLNLRSEEKMLSPHGPSSTREPFFCSQNEQYCPTLRKPLTLSPCFYHRSFCEQWLAQRPGQSALLSAHVELEKGEPISQREIAGRLGIALGRVNSYLKTLAAKGFVTVKAMPRNRFAYLLPPKGFAEKSRRVRRGLSPKPLIHYHSEPVTAQRTIPGAHTRTKATRITGGLLHLIGKGG